MRSQSVYKVPHGKLLRISLDYDEKNKTILEQGLLLKKIQSKIIEKNIQFIGLDAEGLTQGIMMCVS
jgi:hypothetical protein